MNQMKKIILATACTAAAFTAYAQQDFHLSQYESAILYMNPALTGMFCGQKGDYRVASDFRSQWRALGTKPFSTAYIGFDMPLKKYGEKWGAGGYIIDNHAGAGRFTTLNVIGSASYNIMNGTNEHYLTTGLQVGILYKAFNPQNYTYDIQYSSSSGTFDTNIPSQEAFASNSLAKFDANLGLFYKYMGKGRKYHPQAGFSVYHLTKPNVSFTDGKDHLTMRFNFMTSCVFDLREDMQLEPRVLFMNQAKATELNLGALFYYKIKNSSLDAIVGCDYRNKDALIFHIGFRQDQHYFRFSYDVNTSALNNYTGGRGAWEFSLILTGTKNQPLVRPIF